MSFSSISGDQSVHANRTADLCLVCFYFPSCIPARSRALLRCHGLPKNANGIVANVRTGPTFKEQAGRQGTRQWKHPGGWCVRQVFLLQAKNQGSIKSRMACSVLGIVVTIHVFAKLLAPLNEYRASPCVLLYSILFTIHGRPWSLSQSLHR